MNIVILAAGYATRLYPLTKNFPKPLLEVGDQTIVDRMLEQLRKMRPNKIVLVSNQKFAAHFIDWCPADVELVVNNSTNAEDRQGAIGDLALGLAVVDSTENCLVLAADNIFEFDFAEVVPMNTRHCVVGVWQNPNPEDQTRRGNVQLDEDKVVQFVEKPPKAISPWAAAPVYLLTEEALKLVPVFLQDVHDRDISERDAPGHFMTWLLQTQALNDGLRAMYLPAKPIDIGTVEALQAARHKFS